MTATSRPTAFSYWAGRRSLRSNPGDVTSSVYEPGAPQMADGVADLGVPILGICYGLQLLVHKLGGQVEPAEKARTRPAPSWFRIASSRIERAELPVQRIRTLRGRLMGSFLFREKS